MAQQLLTKGLGHKIFKNSLIGEILEIWETKTIDQFAQVTTGSKDTQNKVVDGVYPFFVRSEVIERINSYCFDGEAVLTAGDGVGVGKVFHYIIGKFDYHQRVYNIHCFSKGVLGKFFFEYFKKNFILQVKKYNAKGSVDSVRMDMITKMLVPIPPLDEQEKIATILSTIAEKFTIPEEKKARYQELNPGCS
jgi:type I restriction enzyme S subunit